MKAFTLILMPLLLLSLPLLAEDTDTPPPASTLAGAYRSLPKDDPSIAKTWKVIQDHLAILRLQEVQEASIQVVNGINMKLVCTVSEKEELARWEFVVYLQRDGSSQFTSARRLGPAGVIAE